MKEGTLHKGIVGLFLLLACLDRGCEKLPKILIDCLNFLVGYLGKSWLFWLPDSFGFLSLGVARAPNRRRKAHVAAEAHWSLRRFHPPVAFIPS